VAPPEPTTQQTTQTQATTVATTPAAAPTGPSPETTWTIHATNPGGYADRATITLGPVQHFSATDLPQCQQGDPQTDAEIPGTLTLTNETRGFSDQSGIQIMAIGALIADPNNCPGNGQLPAIVFSADGPLPYGQSITEKIWVIVTLYYDPNHPNGTPSMLKTAELQPKFVDNGAISTGPVQLSGPDAYGGLGGDLFLTSLGRR
jgi:hypothetical protein